MVDTFPIVPAASRSLWVLLAIVLVILSVVAVVLVTTTRGARHSRFEISSAGLRLRGDLYGRLIPRSSLRGGSARIVDLTVRRELAPRLRTLGTAVGGYRAGWFRLHNGEKALLYLTDGRRAVYVPTQDGYSVLLSPQDPERFVERVRALAPEP